MATDPRIFISLARSGAIRQELATVISNLERLSSDSIDLRSARSIVRSIQTSGGTPGKWRTLRTDLERAALSRSVESVCVIVGTPLECYRRSGWHAGTRHWKPMSTSEPTH